MVPEISVERVFIDLRWFTDVSQISNSLPINMFTIYTCLLPTFSLPAIFATQHSYSHPDLGKGAGYRGRGGCKGGDITLLLSAESNNLKHLRRK